MITLGGVHFVRLDYSDFPRAFIKVVFFGLGSRGVLEFHGLEAFCINGLFGLSADEFSRFAHNVRYAHLNKGKTSGYLTAS